MGRLKGSKNSSLKTSPKAPTIVQAEAMPTKSEFFETDVAKTQEMRKLLILRLHAEFVGPSEIEDKINRKYQLQGLATCYSEITRVCEEQSNRYTIQQFRNQYLNKIKSVALSNKRVRLDDLDYVRGRFLEMLRGNMCADAGERAEFRVLSRGLLEVLGAARDEMEGKGITLLGVGVGGGLGLGDFDGKSDTELSARRDELIRQAETALIGRVTGINDNPEGASGP